MTGTGERRDRIADAALDIVAVDGVRGLTHRAVDRHLGLPLGSTSYYFRTRAELLTAAVTHLTTRSRTQFRDVAPEPPSGVPGAAAVIGRYVDRLLTERDRDVRARYALTTEFAHDDRMRASLAASLFSLPDAAALLRALGAAEPDRAAADFVALLEGLVFDRTLGARTGPAPGTTESVDALARAAATFLRGAAHP